MDGTVLATDTLFESIADLLRVQPFWTLWRVIALPFAIARGKAKLQGRADIEVETLPINEEVLEYCRAEHDRGRTVWLVSAADQPTVQAVADRLGVFDRAVGSDGQTNNKGGAKARLLNNAFPAGYEYIGDSPADMKIWSQSRRASIVGHLNSRTATLRKMGIEVGQTFQRPRNRFDSWRKAMRLDLWVTNALIFVVPILTTQISTPQILLKSIIGFGLLGLLSSGASIIDDLLNLKADRAHHKKNHRPFAAGRLKLWQGFVAAPLLILAGLAGAGFLSITFLASLATYLVLALGRSLYARRLPLLNSAIPALLLALRLLMGAAIAGVALT